MCFGGKGMLKNKLINKKKKTERELVICYGDII